MRAASTPACSTAERPRCDDESYEWTAPVWFCEPWTPAFGLLGLTGFFDHFDVTISPYDEQIELTPIDRCDLS